MRTSDFEKLKVFAAVAERGSFVKAATRLGLSTSSVSQSIRTLEDRLGLRLLNRTTRSVGLDGAGDTRFSPADLAKLGAILDRHLKHDFGYAYFETPRGYQVEGARREPVEPAASPWPQAAQAA